MEAREREGMITHRADVMFRLPHAATLDARPCVQRIDDAPPEDVPYDRGRANEEAPLRPAANLGLVRSRLAKEKLESRPWGRNSVADVMERSNCSASGSRNTR